MAMMTMDHREQSRMAAKWQRIWSPTRMTYEVQGSFHFEGELGEGAKLRICRSFEDGGVAVWLTGYRPGTIQRIGELSLVRSRSVQSGPLRGSDSARDFEDFDRRWRPLFRRNCWLSGCDLDCSVQERLEWLPAFPTDAIERIEREMGEEGFLTEHERMELRLGVPREFWPKIWLDEERGS